MHPRTQFFGSNLFNIFFNGLFTFIPKASVHSFVDDTTLSKFVNTLTDLISVLETKCEAEINWLYNYKMIVNPDKFQVTLLD